MHEATLGETLTGGLLPGPRRVSEEELTRELGDDGRLRLVADTRDIARNRCRSARSWGLGWLRPRPLSRPRGKHGRPLVPQRPVCGRGYSDAKRRQPRCVDAGGDRDRPRAARVGRHPQPQWIRGTPDSSWAISSSARSLVRSSDETRTLNTTWSEPRCAGADGARGRRRAGCAAHAKRPGSATQLPASRRSVNEVAPGVKAHPVARRRRAGPAPSPAPPATP